MGWDKMADLVKVQKQGQLCLALLDEHLQKYREAELETGTIDRQVATLDEAAAAWRHNRPTAETFATHAELQKWQHKADTRSKERNELMARRRDLLVVLASERTAMVKLDKENVHLQRCQRNLQAVVDGKNPASGWEGGVFPIP
jgi:hypothetical protein